MEKKMYYSCEPNIRGSFDMKSRMMYGANKNWFLSKEEALIDYNKALVVAQEKYNNILNAISKIKETLGDFSFEYYMIGDTYGIDDSGMYLSFEIDGYEFKFPQY